tara:strand:- start:745 stop:1164 length:420 start_codon:yes stop_codon:yes gene_type:complete
VVAVHHLISYQKGRHLFSFGASPARRDAAWGSPCERHLLEAKNNHFLDGTLYGTYFIFCVVSNCFYCSIGGERGIRTLETLLTFTHFPGVRLQPLGHLSNNLFQISNIVAHLRAQTLMVLKALGNSLTIKPGNFSGLRQ